jgi:DNA-binding winged helix-turn-helix (wHTH) protein
MNYIFGDYILDDTRYELRRSGESVAIEPKAFKVLAHLIQYRDRVVTKTELLEQFWPGVFVSESALTRCLARVRRAVHDEGPQQRVIRTIRGHGYRFVAALATRVTEPAHPAVLGTSRLRTVVGGQQTPPLPGLMLPCPQCQTVNKAERLFCAACGHELARTCPQCGFRNDPGDRFCGGCGNDCATTVALPDNDASRTPLSYTPKYLAEQILTIGDDLRMDYTAQGFTTHLADRLQRLAREGSIYVSEAVRQQAEGFFRFNDVGAYTVPGIAQPVRVYECAGVGQVTSRLAAALRRRVSQFVGREREMTLLRALWTRTCHGQGQVVCLFGEAGVGKSRLAFEAQDILTGGRLLEAQTLSYGQQTPYHAIVPLVRPRWRCPATRPRTSSASSFTRGWW